MKTKKPVAGLLPVQFVSPQYVCIRGVTRLDVTWAKKQVSCPVFEPEIFRKQIYCIEMYM